MFDRAELTADRLTTYRQICRRVGREMGAFACFMPKPFMGVSANGCHHNISLWKGNKNMFMPDGKNPRLPGQIGLWSIGGVLDHLSHYLHLHINHGTSSPQQCFSEIFHGLRVFTELGDSTRMARPLCACPAHRGGSESRSVDSAVESGISVITALIRAIKTSSNPASIQDLRGAQHLQRNHRAETSQKRIPEHFRAALQALEKDPVVK